MNSHNISKLAATYTQYDMITTYTNLPKFPAHRIDLLCTFLTNGALDNTIAEEHYELYSLAIALMQMGLDTHDMVTGHDQATSKQAMRSNQLKVLAGDYFSSRFYQLLANKGYIEFIQRISRAICDLNRLKMDFYLNLQQFRMTAEEYMKQSAQIKMQLFLPFKQMMKQSFSERWFNLLNNIAHCEVICEQLDLDEEDLNSRNSWGYWFKRKHPMKHLRATLLAMLEKHTASIQEQMMQIDCEQMYSDISRIKASFMQYAEMTGKKYEVQA